MEFQLNEINFIREADKLKAVLVFLGMTVFGAPAFADQTVIQQITKKYQAIKKLEPKMVRAELDHAAGESAGGDSDEGSKAEAYRERGVVKEIREEYFGETGRSKYFFFYENGKAFFVIEERTNIAMPMMTEMEGLPKPMQEQVDHKYYLHSGRMIKWTAGKTEVKPGEKFTKRESEILDLAADALENAN